MRGPRGVTASPRRWRGRVASGHASLIQAIRPWGRGIAACPCVTGRAQGPLALGPAVPDCLVSRTSSASVKWARGGRSVAGRRRPHGSDTFTRHRLRRGSMDRGMMPGALAASCGAMGGADATSVRVVKALRSALVRRPVRWRVVRPVRWPVLRAVRRARKARKVGGARGHPRHPNPKPSKIAAAVLKAKVGHRQVAFQEALGPVTKLADPGPRPPGRAPRIAGPPPRYPPGKPLLFKGGVGVVGAVLTHVPRRQGPPRERKDGHRATPRRPAAVITKALAKPPDVALPVAIKVRPVGPGIEAKANPIPDAPAIARRGVGKITKVVGPMADQAPLLAFALLVGAYVLADARHLRTKKAGRVRRQGAASGRAPC